MSLPTRVETLIVGAGHAGLSLSRFLSQAGREHLIVEARETLGGGWQDRWDGFCLVSPNWTMSFPGFPFEDGDPHAFMPRDAIVARVARYASVIGAPVVLGARVQSVAAAPAGGFRVRTTRGTTTARNVVVAAGSFHQPRLGSLAATLPRRLHQIHSHHYRNERDDLPPGAVLLVGSGQSGVQIAEDLHAAGRRVYLSVGTAARAPRRYRGKDVFHWLFSAARDGERIGAGLPTIDMLPTPMAKFAANPSLSGHGGGHETNLREFAQRGIRLLGRMARVEGERVRLEPDLPAKLAFADSAFGERLKPVCDRYIAAAGIDAPPPEELRQVAYEPPVLAEIDLASAGINSVMWTSGYLRDWSWIELPIFDEMGFPRHRRGVTEVPGLYFTGLLWQHNQLSATLPGAPLEARHIAAQLGVEVEEPPAMPPVA